MVTTLVIEDIGDGLLDDLGRMAERSGLTVDSLAKRLLADALRVRERSDLVARLEAIAALTPSGVAQTDSLDMLREDRGR